MREEREEGKAPPLVLNTVYVEINVFIETVPPLAIADSRRVELSRNTAGTLSCYDAVYVCHSFP